MCNGGRLLADFYAGASERPDVPEPVQTCLTETLDGTWVVWAYKLARSASKDHFTPVTAGGPFNKEGSEYPRDAVAVCHRRQDHEAPQPECSCGFHALSASSTARMGREHLVRLDVVLSGRILAFEWADGLPFDVLFRAARQTVMRVNAPDWVAEPEPSRLPPDDPDGWLAAQSEREPRGGGPIRLRLPNSTPASVEIEDDAGYCAPRPFPYEQTFASVPAWQT